MSSAETAAPPFDVVFFDCDSTLSAIEGIDELARVAGVGAQVADLTRQAMEGRVPLEDVYGRRLELIRPDRAAIERLARTYVERVVPGARDVVATLLALDKEVHVVTGGIRDAVLPLTRQLGVTDANVHAVELRFAPDGSYAGHDAACVLARSGGKAAECARVLAGGRRAVIVGDGVTDMEACPPCALAIGFGGVVAREPVRKLAGAWVDGPSLLGVLEHVLSPAEASTKELR